jgi:hypothetical protein
MLRLFPAVWVEIAVAGPALSHTASKKGINPPARILRPGSHTPLTNISMIGDSAQARPIGVQSPNYQRSKFDAIFILSNAAKFFAQGMIQ